MGIPLVDCGESFAACGEADAVCTGLITYIGTVSTTLSGVTVVSAGEVIVEGDVSAEADGSTLDAVGFTPVITGTVTTTIEGATLAAAGELTIEGAGASTTEGVLAAGSGELTAEGTAAITTEGAILTATGGPVADGDLSVVTDGVTGVAKGDSRNPVPAEAPDLFNPEVQQGDINLFQTEDGGDIFSNAGIINMTGDLGPAAYLSLFGGNEQDDTSQKTKHNWWGNLDEVNPSKRYRSETQNLLKALAATSRNLRRIEEAAVRDLSWFKSDGIASAVSVEASIPGIDRLKLLIGITVLGEEKTIEFLENWKVSL